MLFKGSQQGKTLVELVVVLGIAAILASISFPSMQAMLDDSRRRSTVNNLLNFFMLARQEAIKSQRVMTLCPLNTENRCSRNWNGDLHLFLDANNDRKLVDGSHLVKVLPAISNGTLKAASLSRSYFQYRPNGQIYSDLGNVTWCPANKDTRLAAQIIISRGGRVRLAEDADGDGVAEKSDGDPIECI